MLKRLLLVLLILTLLTPGLLAQFVSRPSITHFQWTAADGLPQNSVVGIGQDSDGYLWLGTFGGLARFDGRRFETFDILSRPDLPANRFGKVLIDHEETMWVWAEEKGLLRYRDDQFTRLDTPGALWQWTEDASGQLWGTADRGLFRVSKDRAELVREGKFRAILAADDGAIWVSTLKGELRRFKDDHTTVFGLDAGLPPDKAMQALLVDKDGILWAGCQVGVWRSTDATWTAFEKVMAAPDRVRWMALDEREALWFGCRERLMHWEPGAPSPTEIARGTFDSFLEDDRGNLWVGSRGEGLHCFRYAALHDLNAALDLPPGDTWAITEDMSGTVYISRYGGVVAVQDGDSKWRRYEDAISSVLVDREGDLWIGQRNGLVRVRGEVEIKYSVGSGLVGPVRVLIESRDGTLLVGTARGLYRRDGDRFLQLYPEQLTGIRCVLEDEETGELWIGTDLGLAHIVGESLTWLTVEEGLSPGAVRALHLDPEGVLWAGTYGGGLSRIEQSVIFNYSRANGLADNFISCIFEDDNQRLWINSNSGPFVVHRNDLNSLASGETQRIACISFSHEEGAREANGGRQPAGLHGADGRMWFPSIVGVTIADPKELPLDEAPPNVLIESFEVGEERQLNVRFTALGFSSPRRVRVQYQLIGSDAGWVECLEERTAHYSYLPPGEYEFRVRARNGYGPWSQIVKERFEVESRFHETKTFLIAIGLLSALAALGLAEFRNKRSKARTEELVLLVEEREQAEKSLSRSQAVLRRLSRELLNKQETDRKSLARELHDDLSQRLAALAIQAEVAEARLGKDMGQTRDRLHDIVLMTQQLAGDVQQLSRRLHPVGLRTLGLAEAVRQECDAFARRNEIEVDLEENVASDELPEETAITAFRILQESLHNIEKHACASAVSVRVVLEGGEFILSISDCGKGFDTGSSMDAGLGLVTMQERAVSIGGEFSIISQPGIGTTVSLRTPERRN